MLSLTIWWMPPSSSDRCQSSGQKALKLFLARCFQPLQSKSKEYLKASVCVPSEKLTGHIPQVQSFLKWHKIKLSNVLASALSPIYHINLLPVQVRIYLLIKFFKMCGTANRVRTISVQYWKL